MQNSKRNLVFPGNALPEDGFVDPLVDSFCRKINYIRLAVTDRCNLRCRYCMPESGIPLLTHDAILRFEEIIRLVRQFVRLGIGKIRITGGEPFARGGLVDLIARLRNECPWLSIHITTNGVAASNHIAALKKLGVQGINLSLDTLDPRRFFAISRRNSFSRVWRTFEACLENDLALKINCVVLPGFNTNEIIPLADLAWRYPVTVRFIEQMPFNGERQEKMNTWRQQKILAVLKEAYPGIAAERHDAGTAALYTIPGFQGKIGLIAGLSRHFCHTCNKVRITPQGMLKNCLYDNGVLDLRALLRSGATNREIRRAITGAISLRRKHGFAVEEETGTMQRFSMAAIGG